MINLFHLFLFNFYHLRFLKTTSKDRCKENNYVYKIGENYSKHGDDCRICTCTMAVDVCIKILECKEMSCSEIYSLKCCKKLGCKNTHLLAETIENEIYNPRKSGWYMGIVAFLFAVLFLIIALALFSHAKDALRNIIEHVPRRPIRRSQLFIEFIVHR